MIMASFGRIATVSVHDHEVTPRVRLILGPLAEMALAQPKRPG
jgi:hypothetical protein